MNAYVSREELAQLPANRLSYPEHHAEDLGQRHAGRRNILGFMAAWIERQRAFAALAGLTDRELRDIGLDRADIGRVFEPDFAFRRG